MTVSIKRAKADARSKEIGLLYDELVFQMPNIRPNWSFSFQILRQIDRLVMKMEEDEAPPFTVNQRPSGETQTWISDVGNELLGIIQWMTFGMPEGFHASQRVEIFLRRHFEMKGNFPGTYRYVRSGLVEPLSGQQVKWFNDFASGVKADLRNAHVQRSIRSAESSVEKRYQNACAYVDSLFLKAPDLLLISMEFRIAPTLARATGQVPDEMITLPGRGGVRTLPRVVANVQEMLAKGRHRQAFSAMVGFMGRWSRSEAKGTFARIVFFLDGAKVADAYEAAFAIANEWETKYCLGLGTYDVTCLSEAENGDSYLPVRISREDTKRRRALEKSVILYMTKLGLIYQETALQVRSQFFRGELPTKKPKSSRGKANFSL